METPGPKVAIVDDDEVVRRALRRMIASLAYSPIEFASGEAFLAELANTKFACALIDMHMPGLNGLDIVGRMRSEGRNVPSIIITGGDEPRLQERCFEAGAAGYMVKPIERDAIDDAIRTLLQ
jgi:FixJ family two-component response regulator